MREIFRRIIVDFQERTLRTTIKRDIAVPIHSDKIITLIGVRRCGKTSILYKMIEELRESVDARNIIYINFEDDRLLGTQVGDLDDLIEGYYELYPEKETKRFISLLMKFKTFPSGKSLFVESMTLSTSKSFSQVPLRSFSVVK